MSRPSRFDAVAADGIEVPSMGPCVCTRCVPEEGSVMTVTAVLSPHWRTEEYVMRQREHSGVAIRSLIQIVALQAANGRTSHALRQADNKRGTGIRQRGLPS